MQVTVCIGHWLLDSNLPLKGPLPGPVQVTGSWFYWPLRLSITPFADAAKSVASSSRQDMLYYSCNRILKKYLLSKEGCLFHIQFQLIVSEQVIGFLMHLDTAIYIVDVDVLAPEVVLSIFNICKLFSARGKTLCMKGSCFKVKSFVHIWSCVTSSVPLATPFKCVGNTTAHNGQVLAETRATLLNWISD